MTEQECIFCKIAAGKAPANLLFQDDEISAFHDIKPIAPVHILIIPNRHIASINDMMAEDEGMIGRLVHVAKDLAIENGLEERGYRLLFNTGPEAGQTVYHIHLHLIGGRRLPFHFT